MTSSSTRPMVALAALSAAFVVMGPPGKAGDTMTPHSDNGIITLPSQHSVDQTVEKLQALLRAKGVMLFALVDHSGEAATVGMKLPPTHLVLFGTPHPRPPLP